MVPGPEELAREAADLIAAAAGSRIELGLGFSIALSGGSTPRRLYELLASEPWRERIRWDQVQVFFSDERCVPPDHPDSNFRMACQTLLDQVPIPYENIHRLRGEIEPEAAAREYEQLLADQLGDGGLDLVLLGMGEDGHTASLFPDTPALAEQAQRCVAVYVDKLKSWRLTLTATFINRSDQVMVLVAGAAKTQRLQEVLESPPEAQRLPIQLIRPDSGRLIWLMDSAAAGMIE